MYLFALLESHISRDLWQYADDGLKVKMYAYLHIRNTIAHGFDGKRANRYKKEFDEVMQSGDIKNGILKHDEKVVILTANAWMDFAKLIQEFLKNILHRVINHGYNTP